MNHVLPDAGPHQGVIGYSRRSRVQMRHPAITSYLLRTITLCYPARLLAMLAVISTTLLLAPAMASAAPSDAPAQAPGDEIPTVTIDVPDSGMINEPFTFTATFENTGTGVGYGPFIDIYLPSSLGVGVGSVDVTYLGMSLNAMGLVYTRTFNAAGQVTHPLAVVFPTGAAVVVSGGVQNDRMITIQLPYGSFTPGQPPAEVSITTTMASNAPVGTAVPIRARGGFRYGNTALNDWCCVEGTRLVPNNTQPIATWPTDSITPTIMQVTKAYVGPGNTSDETATGPNFPRQYSVTVNIANGQTVDTLQIVDTLPGNIQYLGVASSTPAGSIAGAPPGPGPGGTLSYLFSAPVTGTASTADATLIIDFFVPIDASGPVIPPSTGTAATSVNTSGAGGTWTNAVAPNTPGAVTATCVDCTHTLTDRSLAIQKEADDITAPVATTRPGDTIEFTLDFQVSDFFAFQDLVIVDVLDDGYEFVLGSANVTVTEHGTPANSAIAPAVAISGATGQTTLTFDISGALAAAQPLLGGCVPAGGTSGPPPDCSFDGGPTTGRLTYQALILEDYRIPNPSGDTSVDHGDALGNSASITGTVVRVSDLGSTGVPVSDDGEASVTITQGELTKLVYAINGVPPVGSPPIVSPGDEVTYRIEYTLPSSDTEYLTFLDYLPLPIFQAAELTTVDDVSSAAAPPAGHAHFHPDDTFSGTPAGANGVSGMVPAAVTNATANSVEFQYGEFDLGTSPPSKVDILFTVTVRNDPFSDGLFLTNQVRTSESNSEGTVTATDEIIQVRLGEPVLSTTKSIVAISTTPPAGTITPTPPAVFNPPGTAGNRWTVPVVTPADVGNRNATGMKGLDLVTFAIIIQNSGSSTRGAFDITITDILQPDYQIPAAAPGLNLRVAYGDGTEVNTPPGPSYVGLGGGPTGASDDDIFGSGIRIADPGLAQGACEAPGHTPDRSYIIITYDLQIRPGVAPLQTIINTGSLTHYAGEEGGPNHLPAPLTEQATVTIGGTSGKSVSRASMTVGESYTQTIDITIPPFTTAYQRGSTGRVYVRDTILDNGARMMPGTATFAQTAACSGTDMSGWTIGGQVLLSEIDQAGGSLIEWSLPAPIDNLTNPAACSFRVTVDLMAVDVDTFLLPAPNLRAWAPPANNLTLDDRARFEYGNSTGGNINGPNSTAAVAIDQPWIRLVKSAPRILQSDGVTPRVGELRRGDFVIYLFTLENRGETTAYEVGVIDTLPEYMQYVGGSAFRDDGTGGGIPGDGIQNGAEPSLGNPSITGAPTPGGQTLTFNYDLDIPIGPANLVPVAFRAQVINGMALGAVFVNIADANWSTLDGSQPTERLYDAVYDLGGPMNGLDTPTTPNQDRGTVTHAGIGLSLTKIFSPPIIAVGANSQLQLTVTNPNATITLTGVSFFDNLPAGLAISGAPALNPAACLGAGATVDALLGGGNITVSNGTLAPGAVCQITLNVTSSAANVYINTTSPVTSTETGPGQTTSDTLIVADTLAIHKRFSPTRIELGQTTSLTFTILNPTGGVLTNVSFTDNLPSGLVVASTPANPICGGALTAPPGGVTIGLTGATLSAVGAGRYCTFSVGVQAQVPGTFTNQTEPISSTETGPTAPSNPAVLEVVAPAVQQLDPVITKTGDPSTAGIGDTVTWTITVTNPSSVAMPNVTVVDAVPDVLDILGVETTQGTSSTNGNIVTITIGTLNPGVTVTIRIRTVVSDRANPPVNITNTAFSGNSSASADLSILPGTLPPTGGRPVRPPLAVWLLLGALLALAAGWVMTHKRAADGW